MSNYGTIGGATTYFAERGMDDWKKCGNDDERLEALVRGSLYIDWAYRMAFPGEKTGLRSQVLEWPRTDAVDIEGLTIGQNEIPREVEWAAYEAAYRELTSPNSLLPDYDPSSQTKREKVDVIEGEYTAAHGSQSVIPQIPRIYSILEPVLTGGWSSSIVGRSVRV